MHRRLLTRAATLAGAALAVAFSLAACGGESADPLASSSESPTTAASSAETSAPGSDGGSAAGPIVVGSANFPESALLANIYAAALNNAGIEATTQLNIGSREIYIPALQDGSIDLIPEYTGALLYYFDPDATAKSADEVFDALPGVIPDGLSVLAKSAAEDKDAVVVTRATADANSLTTIEDLAPVASTFILGGPPEWETRPTGPEGLKEVYGLTFKEFRPLDTGTLTINSLTSDQVQAVNIFTTDPAIVQNDLVILEDPKSLFAAQNILPLITSDKASSEVAETLDAVSAQLTTEGLTELLVRVVVDKEDSAQVAQEWVDANLS